jgi:hypothetical protein
MQSKTLAWIVRGVIIPTVVVIMLIFSVGMVFGWMVSEISVKHPSRIPGQRDLHAQTGDHASPYSLKHQFSPVNQKKINGGSSKKKRCHF